MRGIDAVISKATRDNMFLYHITSGKIARKEAAERAGIELSDIEAQLLEAVPRDQLIRLIIAIRPQFSDEQLDCIPIGNPDPEPCILKSLRFGGIRPDQPKRNINPDVISPEPPGATRNDP